MFSQEYKADKLKKIRDYHKNLINDLGISEIDFNMKMPFQKNGVKVIGVFPSEFRKEKGTFIELIDRNLDPIDPERKVYRIAHSTSYDEEYEINERGSYIVPVEELKIINQHSASLMKDRVLNIPSVNEALYKNVDMPLSALTLKDIIAIIHKVPISDKAFINELIKNI